MMHQLRTVRTPAQASRTQSFSGWKFDVTRDEVDIPCPMWNLAPPFRLSERSKAGDVPSPCGALDKVIRYVFVWLKWKEKVAAA